jgi:GTP pyrophosphokinase
VLNLITPDVEPTPTPGVVGRVIERLRGSQGIKVHGMSDMMFRFAGCCQPLPGEDIVGFITRGRGVTIHRADCETALQLLANNQERKIDVSWDAGRSQSFVVELEMVVEDRKGMLRDVTEAIAGSDSNVRAAEMTAQDSTATGRFVVEVASLSHLNRILDRVRKVKGVISVIRSQKRDTPSRPSI